MYDKDDYEMYRQMTVVSSVEHMPLKLICKTCAQEYPNLRYGPCKLDILDFIDGKFTSLDKYINCYLKVSNELDSFTASGNLHQAMTPLYLMFLCGKAKFVLGSIDC